MHQRWARWLLLPGVLLAGWAAFLLASRPLQAQQGRPGVSAPTAVVQPGSLDRVIRLAGQTSARNYAAITVPALRGQRVTMTLTKMAKGGSTVKQGDLVGELDTQDLVLQLDDLNDSINQSEADLKNKKAQQAFDWETLQQSLRSEKSQLDKATKDFGAAEVKTTIERELLKLAVDEAAATYKQAQANLGFKQTSFQADLRVSEIAYQQLLNRRERMLSDLKHFTFLAPMDGLVVVQSFMRGGTEMVQYQVGDQVQPGQAFIKIVDTASMQLEADGNQAEASEIRVGQPATVSLDAFPGLLFKAKVYSIGAMARQSRQGSYYVRSVPVTVQISGNDSRLIPDLSGAAEVVVEHKENTLIVPLEAVYSEGGKDFVFLKTASGFEKREVEVGLRSTLQAAIVSGLTAGQQVALTKPVAAK